MCVPRGDQGARPSSERRGCALSAAHRLRGDVVRLQRVHAARHGDEGMGSPSERERVLAGRGKGRRTKDASQKEAEVGVWPLAFLPHARVANKMCAGSRQGGCHTTEWACKHYVARMICTTSSICWWVQVQGYSSCLVPTDGTCVPTCTHHVSFKRGRYRMFRVLARLAGCCTTYHRTHRFFHIYRTNSDSR